MKTRPLFEVGESVIFIGESGNSRVHSTILARRYCDGTKSKCGIFYTGWAYMLYEDRNTDIWAREPHLRKHYPPDELTDFSTMMDKLKSKQGEAA